MNVINNLPFLASQIFRRSIFEDIIYKIDNSVWKSIINSQISSELKGLSLHQAFDSLYNIANKGYRNEYIFKNTIANKLIKGRHKLSNVTYVNEFRVLDSICDVAIFNGTSTAYEIKTELDNFDRLKSQLSDYKKVFDKINIVTVDSKVKELEDIIPEGIGIIQLTKNNILRTIKEPSSNLESLSQEAMLSCLRPTEILLMMNELFDYSPSISPKQTKQECIHLFKSLDITRSHESFVKTLRRRSLTNKEKELIYQLPTSLLALILNIKPSSNKIEKIIYSLNNTLIDN